MKILHTADWHIGKLVHGIHMFEEQEYILDQFVQFAREVRPDIVLIAGDVYDRSIPPEEAVNLLNSVLTTLVLEEKITTILISGNHDSSERLGFANKILQKQGLYIYHDFEDFLKPVILEDDKGEVYFYALPYIDPTKVRFFLDKDTIRTHEDAFREIIYFFNEQYPLKENENRREVLMTHGYFVGEQDLTLSDSERPLSIGGSDAVPVSLLERFDYVALGHLHQPQKVSHPNIRYAGSLMKYSFSEATQSKSVTLVDIDAKGSVSYQLKSFEPLRDLRVITGKLEALISENVFSQYNKEDYIMAILTDEVELYEPMNALRQVYKNMLRLEKQMQYQLDNNDNQDHIDFSEYNVMELYEHFYLQMTNQTLSLSEVSNLTRIIDEGLKITAKEGK